MRADARGFGNVQGAAQAGGQHFGREVVITIDLDDLADKLEAVGRNVVEPAHERAHEVCAGFCDEQRLRR